MNTIKAGQIIFDSAPEIITETTSDFKVSVKLDFLNKRLKVLNYKTRNYTRLTNFLSQIAAQNNLEKIIIIAREKDWSMFVKKGFSLEAFNPYHFKGRPGYYLAGFLTVKRRKSSQVAKKDEIVRIASAKGKYKSERLKKNFSLRPAKKEDIPELINLYRNVFASYPTPIYEREYLAKAMANDTFFMLVSDRGGKVVSAASAEMDKENLCAEVTDCATLPEFRGNKLMYYLIKEIEKEMKKRNLISLYTIARAISPGINTAFSRNNYKYFGRFIKNCHICGNLEDMNLWVKKI